MSSPFVTGLRVHAEGLGVHNIDINGTISASTKFCKRIMLATFPLRCGRVVLTAILLVRAPNNSDAHNLRRMSESGTTSKSSTVAASNLDIEGEGVHGGFEVVRGPIHPISTKYERRRSAMRREEEMELEDVVEPNEFVNDESLIHVSCMIDLQDI